MFMHLVTLPFKVYRQKKWRRLARTAWELLEGLLKLVATSDRLLLQDPLHFRLFQLGL